MENSGFFQNEGTARWLLLFPDNVILALNETRKTLVASRLQRGRARRSKPVSFESAIAHGGGVWVEGCHRVDTSGMRAPIDLLFLDGESRVVGSFSEILPGESTPEVASARGVLQLPAGTIRFSQTETGDRVSIETVLPEPARTAPRVPSARLPRRSRSGGYALGRGSQL